MGRHDFAIARWQRTEFDLGFGEQRVDLFQVGLTVAFVVGFVRRVGGDQRLGDVADIELSVRQIVPGVRVGNRLAIFIGSAG